MTVIEVEEAYHLLQLVSGDLRYHTVSGCKSCETISIKLRQLVIRPIRFSTDSDLHPKCLYCGQFLAKDEHTCPPSPMTPKPKTSGQKS